MTIPQVYFPLVDDQIESHVRPVFVPSFFIHLLFRGDLVITDGFCFASRLLLETLPNEVLIPCLRHGAMRPFFRNSSNEEGSFVRGLEDWRDTTIALNALPDVDLRMRQLDSALRQERGAYKPGYWPSPEVRSVSRSFAEIVGELVGAPKCPVQLDDEGAARLWEGTRILRTDLVEEAIERTGGGGLRRGELLQVVGEHLAPKLGMHAGWTKKQKVNATDDLLKNLKGSYRQSVDNYFSWIADCYAYAQADAFEVERVFSPTVMYHQLISLATLRDDPMIDELSIYHGRILIPRPQALLQCQFDELLQIRQDAGGEYFAALSAYRVAQSESGAELVRQSLERYAAALRRRFADEDVPIEVVFAGSGFRTKAAIAFVLSLLCLPLPVLVSAALASIVFSYRVLSRELRHALTGSFTWRRIKPRDILRVRPFPVQIDADGPSHLLSE